MISCSQHPPFVSWYADNAPGRTDRPESPSGMLVVFRPRRKRFIVVTFPIVSDMALSGMRKSACRTRMSI